MQTLTAILALLFISAVSPFPAGGEGPQHDFDTGAIACRDSDQDLQALRKNKADGSAFCSTYLQITRTSTITPVITTSTTKWITQPVRMIVVKPVRFIVNHIARTIVTRTASMTVTKTSTASVTDFKTQMITTSQTDDVTSTDTAQVTQSAVVQVTQQVTQRITSIVTATIYKTSTTDITSISTIQITTEVPTTITVTSTAEPATATVSYPIICGAKGYGNSAYSIGKDTSITTFNDCKAYCSTLTGAASFVYSNGGCTCYSAQMYVVLTRRNSGSTFTFSDMVCPAAVKPARRAAQVDKKVPAYLPLKGASDVSSACSCHITNKPAAPATTTINAADAKIFTSTVKSFTKAYCKITNYVTVTSQRTISITDFKTRTETDYRTVTISNLESFTVTRPVIITVTEVEIVTITNVNTVEVTNYNTVYTTDVDTSLATDLETVLATDVDYLTATDYQTVAVTITNAATITPSPVTVTVAGETTYG